MSEELRAKSEEEEQATATATAGVLLFAQDDDGFAQDDGG
jgi:hypothetical protein